MSSVESADSLVKRMEEAGYVIFRECRGKAPNLNLVVSRAIPGSPNAFDDQLFCIWWDEHEQIHALHWMVTADPGFYYLYAPMRRDGTAVLCHPQQIRAGFTLGKHKGAYDCLVQTRPLKVWRDANKDGIVDYGGKEYIDSQGIQIHKAGEMSTQVGKWSAGCVVFAREADFEEFMALVMASAKVYGKTFTLTILDSQRW